MFIISHFFNPILTITNIYFLRSLKLFIRTVFETEDLFLNFVLDTDQIHQKHSGLAQGPGKILDFDFDGAK